MGRAMRTLFGNVVACFLLLIPAWAVLIYVAIGGVK